MHYSKYVILAVGLLNLAVLPYSHAAGRRPPRTVPKCPDLSGLYQFDRNLCNQGRVAKTYEVLEVNFGSGNELVLTEKTHVRVKQNGCSGLEISTEAISEPTDGEWIRTTRMELTSRLTDETGGHPFGANTRLWTRIGWKPSILGHPTFALWQYMTYDKKGSAWNPYGRPYSYEVHNIYQQEFVFSLERGNLRLDALYSFDNGFQKDRIILETSCLMKRIGN